MWHSAVLFAAGNTFLALTHAEVLGISLNVLLVLCLIGTRWWELRQQRSLGIPFVVLAAVNVATAVSIEVNVLRDFGTAGPSVAVVDVVAAQVSAACLVLWALGHIMAGRRERLGGGVRTRGSDPQVYYGFGDLAAVNAAGTVNPFSFPFVVVGLMRSLVRPGPVSTTANRLTRFAARELTAARLYGIGFAAGAATSTAAPAFSLAQTCWTLAYFRFPRH